MSAMVACARMIRPPPPSPLHGAARDEAVHAGREPARGRPHDEDGQRDDEQVFAAEQVAQLAVDWHHDGGRQDVRRGHPLHMVDAAQIAHDGGKRGGRHRLGQRADEHGQQQASEHGGHAARMLGFGLARGHAALPRRRCGKLVRAGARRRVAGRVGRGRGRDMAGACCGRRRIKGRRALGIVDGRGQRGGFGFVAFVHARRVRGRERRPVYAFHACSLSLRDPFQYGRGRADEHAAAAHGNRTVSRASRTRGEARQRPNEAREQRRNAGAE